MANSVVYITDEEFGTVAVKRFPASRHIRIKIDHSGALSATIPQRAALRHVYDLLDSSRASLRKSLDELRMKKRVFVGGDRIGSSHSVKVVEAPGSSVKLRSPYIIVSLPDAGLIASSEIQTQIRAIAERTLRAEAKAYLPRRLSYLAEQYGFHYSQVRFSSASTRWGSCSSRGTISLNIWLMGLNHELIDYVIIHELCHTRHMDHSPAFWALVEQYDPDYKAHRRELKTKNPGL